MRKLFFANWKMYLRDSEAEALAHTYAERAVSASVDVVVAPSFTVLERVAEQLEGSPVALGAQDAFWKDDGAFTGEISPKQLAALGVTYVIVGHSERRALGETDEMIARKATAVAADGLTPVLCVGETKEEREAGREESVVRAQLESVISTWSSEHPLLVAYEPRWAIGTGTPCRPEDVSTMHTHIRQTLEARGFAARVLYGGSVDPSNMRRYIDLPEVDGLLVGGASAHPDDAHALFDLLQK